MPGHPPPIQWEGRSPRCLVVGMILMCPRGWASPRGHGGACTLQEQDRGLEQMEAIA